MLRDVHPQDVSVEPFKTFKRFTFTNTDSGSGIYALNAQSGSLFNFMTGSAASRNSRPWRAAGSCRKAPRGCQARPS